MTCSYKDAGAGEPQRYHEHFDRDASTATRVVWSNASALRVYCTCGVVFRFEDVTWHGQGVSASLGKCWGDIAGT